MSAASGTEYRLTPDAAAAAGFPQARFGRRGYDEEHVRGFCADVEAELVRLLNERTSLQAEVARLRQRVLGRAGDDGGYARDEAHVQAVSILSRAQLTADQYVADAEKYSRQLAQDARRRRDEILSEAQSHAALVLDQAHGEASRAAQDALLAPAAVQSAERSQADAELAYLRTFSEVYRTHLHAYLEALMRSVQEWEHAEESALAGVRADAGRAAQALALQVAAGPAGPGAGATLPALPRRVSASAPRADSLGGCSRLSPTG